MGQNDEMWWRRFIDAAEELGLDRKGVHLRTGVPHATLKKWYGGNVTNGPSKRYLDWLCNGKADENGVRLLPGLKINEAWLMQGVGPKFKMPQNKGDEEVIDVDLLTNIIDVSENWCESRGERPNRKKYALVIALMYMNLKEKGSDGLAPTDVEAIRRHLVLIS